MRAARQSRAPKNFVEPIEAFLGFISLERGLSPNTIAAYRRDLDQAAKFLLRRRATSWRDVTAAQAGEWVHGLSNTRYAIASLARKLAALRMLARFLVAEKIRDDDF